MSSISKLQTTSDGRRYWKIQVSRGRGASPISTRFYWPAGHSEKTALSKLSKFAAAFEMDVKAGLVLDRQERAELKKQEAAARAELKTVKQYAEGVFMAKKNLELAETTRTSYQAALDKYIYPAIGDCLINEVTPAMIQKIILDFQLSGKSLSYARTLYVVLNGIFTSAYRDETINSHPMLKVDKPKQTKDTVKEPEAQKALSLSELAYVLQCVENEPLKWQVYMNLSADTGARRGELCGLQWSDIDFKSNTITIRRNLQYTPQKGVYISTPKNGKMRTVDIGQETSELLNRLQEENRNQAKSYAEKNKVNVITYNPWVFIQEGTTDPMHPDSPTRYFKKFGDRYNLPGFHPHLLRHTSASLAITEGGADVVSVSARLGHSDTAITLRMYSHANEESIRRAGQGVRDALKRQAAQKQKAGEN